MLCIVFNFLHHSKVKVEETAHQIFRGTDMNGQEDRLKQAGYKLECLNTCCSPTLAMPGQEKWHRGRLWGRGPT